MISTSKVVILLKDVPSGDPEPKTKFYILIPFSPKKRKLSVDFGRDLENSVGWCIGKSTLTNQNMSLVSTPVVD